MNRMLVLLALVGMSRAVFAQGDDCATATEIILVPSNSVVVAGSTEGLDATCSSSCIWDSYGPDAFYYFDLNQCTRIAISLDSADMHLSVYEGSENCCVLESWCNNEWADFTPLPDWHDPAQYPDPDGGGSYIAAEMGPGRYYVRVAQWLDEDGPYTLTIYHNGICPITAGEDCEDAGFIPVIPNNSITVSGTTSGHGGGTCTDSCIWNSVGADVFYAFELLECRRIAIASRGGDTHISVYNGIENCCLTPQWCNDEWYQYEPVPEWDNPSQHPTNSESYIVADMPAGYYIIRQGYFANNEGPYELTIYDNGLCTLAGDDCENATQIALVPEDSVVVYGSTVGYDSTCANECDWNSLGADGFYYFEIEECRRIAMKLTNFDMHLAVYREECCGEAEWCNDEWYLFGSFFPLPEWDNPDQHPEGFSSYIAADMAPGRYYVRVGYYDYQEGPYTLTIYDNGPCVLAPNDDCATAEEIILNPDSSVSESGSTLYFTPSCSSSCFWDSYGQDAFYYFDLTECTRIAMKLESDDMHISVYEGEELCCAVESWCNDEWYDFVPLPEWDDTTQHPLGNSSYIAAEMGAGRYYIRVGYYADNFGPYTLTIYHNGFCPLNAPEELVISPVGSDAVLSWNPSSSAESYRIFRDIVSPVIPDTLVNLIDTTVDTFYVDQDVFLDATPKFYKVVAYRP